MVKTRLLNDKNKLPWLVESVENGKVDQNLLVSWFKDNKDVVDRKLLEHGAVLFRGFGVNTPAAFARVSRAISTRLIESMEENVPRTKLTAGVYTSTEYPAEYRLSMHSEYSYSNRWPAKLFFGCIKAAERGGETPVADNRDVLAELPPRIVEEFKNRRVRYLRNLHGGQGFGLSWQTAFQTKEKAVVEDYCRAHDVAFEWKSDDGLRLHQTLSGIVSHPSTGEEVWFNQAPQFHFSDYPSEIYQSLLSAYKDPSDLPQDVCFGDGTPISVEDLHEIRETMNRKSVIFPWEEGDLLMVDNVMVSHGRMPFVGSRKTLVAMSE